MKKILLAVALIALVASPVLAQQQYKHLSGSHYQFNIIGSPKGISGDTSNGRTIMVPLRNAGQGAVPMIACEADPYVWADDVSPTYTDQVPLGAKIYFEGSNTFEIVDRDATDGAATVKVPVDANRNITFDIYLRVLGKPNTCMDIDTYAVDTQNGTQYYFWAGSIDVNRKTGQSNFIKVNYLFDVWFCQIDPTTGACTAGTAEELSVFNNIFESYFWNIQNNGTRLVQVRLYPRGN